MKHKYSLLIVLTFMYPLFLAGQSKNTSSRPPWLMGEAPSWTQGELPVMDLRGNYLMVKFGQDADPEIAESKAEEALVSTLVTKYGSKLSRASVIRNESNVSSNSTQRRSQVQSHSTRNSARTITVDGEVYGRFCLLDRYIQYKGGRYYYAGLYLVAEKDMSLASVPPITYGMDRGAWRSLIVPGWAQFYTGRTGAGIAFLGTEAALIGTTVYFQSRVNFNRNRLNEATSIDVKQEYKRRYDRMSMFRNIAAGASIAWYAYNAIDAFTSKRGKLYYTVAYGQNYLSLEPSPIIIPESGTVGFGLACNFRF